MIRLRLLFKDFLKKLSKSLLKNKRRFKNLINMKFTEVVMKVKAIFQRETI